MRQGKVSGFLWISRVTSDAIGLLLGKDFHKQAGLKFWYAEDLVERALLGLRSSSLDEVDVGHYKFSLMQGEFQAPG